MGIANRAIAIDAKNTEYRALFYDEMAKRADDWSMLAYRSTSKGSSTVFNWFNDLPVFSLFTGAVAVTDLRAEDFEVKNYPYGGAMDISWDDYDDDKDGDLRARIASLANGGSKLRRRLIYNQLTGAFTTVCFDGQYLCDTDHPTATSTQSNMGTPALAAAAFNTAMAEFLAFTDFHGEPLDFQPTHLICGPSNRATARSILYGEDVSDGTTTVSNINQGQVELIISPKLTGTSAAYWFLADFSDPVLKPFVLVDRTDTEIISENRPSEFLTRWVARARLGCGPMLWQKIWGSNGTT